MHQDKNCAPFNSKARFCSPPYIFHVIGTPQENMPRVMNLITLITSLLANVLLLYGEIKKWSVERIQGLLFHQD